MSEAQRIVLEAQRDADHKTESSMIPIYTWAVVGVPVVNAAWDQQRSVRRALRSEL
jgi:hypothetical protein